MKPISAYLEPLRRRPAVAVTLLFMLGICWRHWLGDHLAALLGISALLAAVAHFFDRPALPAMIVGIILAGACAGDLAANRYPADHIGLFVRAEPHLAEVEATISDVPRLTADPRGRHLPPHETLTTEVRRIRLQNGWADASGALLVSITEPAEALAVGQRIRLLGMLQRPAPPMNPGQFDWSAFYRSQRLLATMRVNHAGDVQVLAPANAMGALALSCLHPAAVRLLQRGTEPGRELDAAVLAALVLGERDPILRPVEEQFRACGAAHLLASSGLRVALLVGCLLLLCRVLCVPPAVGALLAMGAVILLGLIMFPTPQALRPILISTTLGAALLGRRRVDPFQVLALVALSILVVAPLDLDNAGFQLGFVIVAGMLLLTRPFLEFLQSFQSPDRRATTHLFPPSWFQRLRLALLNGLAASVIAWIVSLPLVACHFEQFTPWAVPVSLILSPLVFATLVGGFLKIVLTLLIPAGASCWSMAALAPALCVRAVVGWLSQVPLADLPAPVPPISLICFYYLLICFPLLARSELVAAGAQWVSRRWPEWGRGIHHSSPKWRWAPRVVPLAAFAMFAWSPLRDAVAGPPANGSLRVTLLSLGAGQCAVLELPSGRAMLIDAGSSTLSDTLRTCLEPFLRHEGRSCVDVICLSHGDYDHISAAREAARRYHAREVLVSPHFIRHASESHTATDLLQSLDRLGRPPRLIARGDQIDLGEGAALSVLWPPARCDFDSNNTGLVLRLTYGHRSILFPADIQEPAERQLLGDPGALKSDVLVAPHHGSFERTTQAFVAAVDPQVVLSSNASRLTTKQRQFEEAMRSRPLFRTPQGGALTLSISSLGEMALEIFNGGQRWSEPSDTLIAQAP